MVDLQVLLTNNEQILFFLHLENFPTIAESMS